jgi:hypothetical protein
MGWYGLDGSGSGQGPVEGSCEHGNEPLGSIKCWEVLEWLHNWQLSGRAQLSKKERKQVRCHVVSKAFSIPKNTAAIDVIVEI